MAYAAFLIGLLVTLTGCGLFGSGEESPDAVVIRTEHPTFTPTVAAAPPTATADAASQAQATPVPPAANSGQASGGARAVINDPLVNARSGPGTDFDVIGEVERGEEFDIVGVNPDRSWWQICCIDNAQAWVISEYVDTLGAVDGVPVIGASGQVQEQTTQPTPTEAAAQVPPTPAVTAAPVASFDLEAQEQFPETSVVRIFLYVYSGNSALEGYSIRVTKDGTQLPVDGSSFGGQPAFTWPFQDPRQRFQNFKIEFSDPPPQGVWEVQLVDNTGATVGPAATFTLSAKDLNQELYVRYVKR